MFNYKNNEYIDYFGYRYYKLVITDDYYHIIDLATIEKPIKDFMFLTGFVGIERFDEYLINTLPCHTVDQDKFFSDTNDIETVCGIKDPYILYFKKRYYTIVTRCDKDLVFDLLDVDKPIEFFYFDFVDRVDREKFNKYLINYVPFEVEENDTDNSYVKKNTIDDLDKDISNTNPEEYKYYYVERMLERAQSRKYELQEELNFLKDLILDAIENQKTEIGKKALRQVIEDYNEWMLGHKE